MSSVGGHGVYRFMIPGLYLDQWLNSDEKILDSIDSTFDISLNLK